MINLWISYWICSVLGAFLALLIFVRERVKGRKGPEERRWPEDVTSPGVRGRSDDYLGQGGVGGVEAESCPPGLSQITNNGGIGGAEGADDTPSLRSPAMSSRLLSRLVVSLGLMGFGATGLLLAARNQEETLPSSLVSSLLGGLLAGSLPCLIALFFRVCRARK
jgi:hypothetical protein